MTEAWDHHEPVEVRFGAGRLEELPGHVGDAPVLLVTTPGMTRRHVTHRVEGLLEEKEVALHDEVGPNPTIRQIQAARERFAGEGIKTVVAVGGGSVLDTAKTLSVLLVPANAGVALDAHLRDAQPLKKQRPLPFVAVPTTAGTGSEVTPFATVWDDELGRKHSVTTPWLHPGAALVDPELTVGLPEAVTLSSGMDALSHAMESVWNRNATPVTRLYAQRAVASILEYLPRVLEEPESLTARSRMMEGSLLAGLAIAITRTALAHSISYPLTARHGLAHGLACSFTLPALLRYNAQEDDGRLAALARAAGCRDVERLAGRIEALYQATGAAGRVRDVLSGRDALLDQLDEMFTPQRAGNNMRQPDRDAVRGVLEESAARVVGF